MFHNGRCLSPMEVIPTTTRLGLGLGLGLELSLGLGLRLRLGLGLASTYLLLQNIDSGPDSHRASFGYICALLRLH